MKLFGSIAAALLWLTAIGAPALAQTFARSPTPSPSPSLEDAKLELLIKKVDEQNAKIDLLSQQILKLEQQIANPRPGVMIGEATPTPGAVAAPTTEPARTANGNTHVVARGETLTSIAKMHNVTVSELQKHNHIENDRKLQIGQTIMIPSPNTAASPAPSASP